MMLLRITMIMSSMITCLTCLLVDAESFNSLNECLVTNNIGIYSFKGQRANMGNGSGVVGLAGHFDKDHSDTVCTGSYSNINQLRGLPQEELRQKLVSVKVEVTQHAGSDSDKWLLHEVESGFRKSKELGATYVAPNPIRDISGSKIFYTWGYYRWISNSVVVSIQFTDYTGTKPEPLEIVQAYLQKFPSTITLTDAEAKDRAHSEQWIKDEMDRRLWLCDRWFAEYQLGKVDQGKVLNEAVDHMNVFLDYRQKYYGISAKDEKIALDNYLQQKDEPSIKSKLTEYKTWWSANKTGTINLP